MIFFRKNKWKQVVVCNKCGYVNIPIKDEFQRCMGCKNYLNNIKVTAKYARLIKDGTWEFKDNFDKERNV